MVVCTVDVVSRLVRLARKRRREWETYAAPGFRKVVHGECVDRADG